MPNQVDGAFVRAMSGTELSRVRTEFRPRPPRTYQLKPLESRAAEIVMQSSARQCPRMSLLRRFCHYVARVNGVVSVATLVTDLHLSSVEYGR